jgi:hypothetical protein
VVISVPVKPFPETTGAGFPIAPSIALETESKAGSASPVTVMLLNSEMPSDVEAESGPLDVMAKMAAPPITTAMIAPTINLPRPDDELLMTIPFVCWEGW